VKTFNTTVSFLFELGLKLLIIQGFVLVTLSLANMVLLGLNWALPGGWVIPDARVMTQIALGRLISFGRTALSWLKQHRRLAWFAGLALAGPALVGLALLFPAGRSLLKTALSLTARWWAGSPHPAQWVAVEPLPVMAEELATAVNNGRH